MRLAVSNIAWGPAEDGAAYRLLAERGVGLLEIAPPRIWPQPEVATPAHAAAFRASLEPYGLSVVAFQALLFGRPELTLFDAAAQPRLLAHLCHLCDLAAELGATALVFGSPKNRLRGALSQAEALEQAREFFTQVGHHAVRRGVHVCLEPNPPQYGGDFLTGVEETAGLVRAVASPGIGLHFDTGGMALAQEDGPELLRRHLELAVHFHASQPMLEAFDQPRADHPGCAAALRAASYQGAVSIEMKAAPQGLAAVATAIDYVTRTYGP